MCFFSSPDPPSPPQPQTNPAPYSLQDSGKAVVTEQRPAPQSDALSQRNADPSPAQSLRQTRTGLTFSGQ